ncbi:15420_t:CDS:2 [Entrophospora sp. SA101]|nr:15420_t:CDS:2 [Entrophospora sp. SA101]
MATIEKIEEKLKIAEEKLENAKKKSEKLKEEGNMKLDELKVKLSGKKLANDEKAMWEVEKKSLEKQEEDLKANMNVWKEDAEKQGEALQKKLDKEVGNEQIAYGMDNSNRQNLQGPNTRDRWVPPTHVTRTIPKVIEDQMSIDVVQHKVTALLNKLTLEKFDVISDQIIEYANKSKFEKDCCILKEVLRLIQLTFEKLCHECDKINFGQMHAQLCKRMMEMIDPEVTDENVKNNDGELVSGGTLFRKFLLKHCQEDFEKVSKVNIPIPSNEKGELDLLSDEYYYSTKAKRSRLGLMCFLGELFKLGMFTERAMHECILSQIQNANEVPGEEAIENLCKLLTTVGKQLDHGHDKAKNPMDVYFNRMDEMSKNKAFSSRIRFMLQDVIDLRNYKWIPRHDNNAPKTISEVHEDAAKQKSSGGRGMLKMTERISHGGFPHHNFIQPLEQTKDRWVPPTHVTRTIPKVIKGQVSIDVVQRKVTALLNKLTLEKFDVISDQIIEYANKSKFEKDCCIFKEVLRLIQLTFEKLCHECDKINFGQMHAQLCRKMMEMIDPEVTDENVKNNDGELVSGGTLFRKFLLKHCQEDFEKVLKVNIPVPSNEKGELDLLSDEYYHSTKAKRSRLGLMCFIGELFKLNMLTERIIISDCIRRLLQVQSANEVPGEEAIENLCKLLTTVGKQLDHGHDRTKNLDVIDLRNNEWIPRHDNNVPKTISEIHKDAANQKEESAKILRQTASSGGRGLPEKLSHSGSGRHYLKDSQTHGPNNLRSNNEGWSTLRAPSSCKPINLSKFGSVSRDKVSRLVSLNPTGLIPSGKGWKVESREQEEKSTNTSRINSITDIYSILDDLEIENPVETLKLSQTTERRRIMLTPRTSSPKDVVSNLPPKTTNITNSVPLVVEINAVAKTSVSSMSIEIAQRKIRNMVEEYFSVLDISELPIEYHSRIIKEFANMVLEKKQEDVHNVAKLFKKLVSDHIVKKSDFKEGLIETVNFLVDIGVDAPLAYEYTGQLLCGAKMDFKDIQDLFKPLIELNDFKGTEKVMKGYLTTLKEEMDEESILKMMNKSNFDFTIVEIDKIFPTNKFHLTLKDIEWNNLTEEEDNNNNNKSSDEELEAINFDNKNQKEKGKKNLPSSSNSDVAPAIIINSVHSTIGEEL